MRILELGLSRNMPQEGRLLYQKAGDSPPFPCIFQNHVLVPESKSQFPSPDPHVFTTVDNRFKQPG